MLRNLKRAVEHEDMTPELPEELSTPRVEVVCRVETDEEIEDWHRTLVLLITRGYIPRGMLKPGCIFRLFQATLFSFIPLAKKAHRFPMGLQQTHQETLKPICSIYSIMITFGPKGIHTFSSDRHQSSINRYLELAPPFCLRHP